MKVTRAGTYLGAVVEDFQLDPGDPRLGDLLKQLLNSYKVVMFRRQFLTPETHRAVAATIGPPEVAPPSARRRIPPCRASPHTHLIRVCPRSRPSTTQPSTPAI